MIQNAIKILLGSCVGLNAASFLCLLFGRKRAGAVLFACGWAGTATIFILNWIACGEPPFGNMYHVLIFLAVSFLPLYVLLVFREKLSGLMHYFAFASAIPLAGAYFMDSDIPWRRMPALQSPWFVPHVFSYMVSYALAAIAFSVTAAAGIRRYILRRMDTPAGLEAGYKVTRLAFPFMTFGLLSGALWAEEAWGRYWSWDPKETWALITWLMYVIYFHCRMDAGLRKYEALAQLLAFLALLSTFVLVNVLPKLGSALHSYAS